MRITPVIFLSLCILLMGFQNVSGQDFYESQRKGWLQKAEQNTPKLISSRKAPRQVVGMVKDAGSFQGWKVQQAGHIDTFYTTSFKEQSGIVIDFGEHMTGYVSFVLKSLKTKTPDSPARFRFTFGEVPSEIAVSFEPYTGTLSRAWLQDETVTAMLVPDTIRIPRRLSFRYVKIDLIGVPGYDFAISDMWCDAVTSVSVYPEELPASVSPVIRHIDRVGLATLKECMQTVYEDGPKRDQRLWIGDLYLESLGNNYSYKQFDLTKRCLYLVAGIADKNRYLYADAFEKPYPHPEANQFLYEYALLFNVTLKDYLVASGDRETAEDLWPVARKQLEIVNTYLQKDGKLDFEKASKEWWIFFDWKDGLYKEVAFQGVSIFACKETYELAKLLGREKEVDYLPQQIKRMTAAARKYFYDKKTGLFVGTANKQISYASQVWMILSGVPSKAEGKKALTALAAAKEVCTPGTPYLYHYYIQSLVDCGMQTEARSALIDFWGGMISKGADTFWEAYDPQNDYISPYNFYPINSYCHAWSCTPVYFIRKYPQIFY